MDQFIKVAGREGKVGGYFCRLPPLNENTVACKKNYHFLFKWLKILHLVPKYLG